MSKYKFRKDFVSSIVIFANKFSSFFQDYTISFTLHSSWHDIRLAQNETESLVMRGENIDKIWRPDLYFPLEKSHELHFVMGDDRVVRILPNGEVWFSTK